MDILKQRNCVIQHRNAQLSVKYYNYLSELFLHTQMQFHKGWYDYVDEVRDRLNSRILRKNPQTNWLEINFHSSIYQLIREAECMLRLELDLPQLCEVMVFCEERVLGSYKTLNDLILENNRIRMSVDMVLLSISRPSLKKLELAFKPGLSTVTWISDNLDNYFEHVQKVGCSRDWYEQNNNNFIIA